MKRLASPLMLAVLLLWSAALPAATITLATNLFGGNENPSNNSPGTGTGIVIFDTLAHTMRVIIEFSGLTGTTTAAHIHCCVSPDQNGPVATTTPTFPGFPSGVSSGSYDNIFDTLNALTYSSGFLGTDSPGDAETRLFNAMVAGLTYLNIHSAPIFGGGEIRGQLRLVVPEPASIALLGLALVVAGAMRKRLR